MIPPAEPFGKSNADQSQSKKKSLFHWNIPSSSDKTDARTAALTSWGQRNSCFSCWSSPLNPNMAASSCDGTQNDCYSDKKEQNLTSQIMWFCKPSRLAKVNLQFSLFPNTSRQLVCWSQPSLTSPLDILNPLIECRKIISSTLISICFKVEASPGEPISDISKGNIVWYSVKLHYITCTVCKALPAGASLISNVALTYNWGISPLMEKTRYI